MKTIDCKRCSGTGQFPRKGMDCFGCNGSGKRAILDANEKQALVLQAIDEQEDALAAELQVRERWISKGRNTKTVDERIEHIRKGIEMLKGKL